MSGGFKCRTPALFVIFIVLLVAVLLAMVAGPARAECKGCVGGAVCKGSPEVRF